MKKIFTLFAVALLGVGAYAQCPTKLELTEMAPGQPADAVELELGIVENSSLNLNGFNMEIGKPDGATWKRAQGLNYFSAKGYAPYILERINVDGMTAEDLRDEALEEVLSDMLDCNSSVKAEGGGGKTDVLVVIEILKKNECRFFPNHAGKVGKCKIDMSALADGEYELVADAAPYGCAFSYTGGDEGTVSITTDEPIVIKLKKEGDNVSEVQTGVNVINASKNVTGVTYYNLQGIESATPFDGVNIMVRTYEDGSKDSVKFVK